MSLKTQVRWERRTSVRYVRSARADPRSLYAERCLYVNQLEPGLDKSLGNAKDD